MFIVTVTDKDEEHFYPFKKLPDGSLKMLVNLDEEKVFVKTYDYEKNQWLISLLGDTIGRLYYLIT
ncbi:MAG: hypothetical protein GYA51_08280 [Candidatus Methanofastidiosa archaeon]|nr:hypothetical protein [Candidatus Methanofastidiosa archaeon]